jgi:hypothetical protein
MRKLMSSTVLVLGLLVSALTLVSQAAYANGGTWPSNAPTMSPGVAVSGGAASVDTYTICCNSPGVQYWKLPLSFGDRLTLNYENVTGRSTGVCVLAPNVTDYTVGSADCVVEDQTDQSPRDQLTFTSPSDGAWLLAVYDASCCPVEAWAYTMTATVQHRTVVSALAPSHRHRGKRMVVHGQLAPAMQVPVQVQRKFGTAPWTTIATLTTAADGSYAKRTRLPLRPGLYKYRVLFGGNATALPSRAVAKVFAN